MQFMSNSLKLALNFKQYISLFMGIFFIHFWFYNSKVACGASHNATID